MADAIVINSTDFMLGYFVGENLPHRNWAYLNDGTLAIFRSCSAEQDDAILEVS